MTAVRNAEIFDRAMSAGADDLVVKPVLANELVGRVRFAVRARALRARVFRLSEMLSVYRGELARSLAPVASSGMPPSLDRLSDLVAQMIRLTEDAPASC